MKRTVQTISVCQILMRLSPHLKMIYGMEKGWNTVRGRKEEYKSVSGNENGVGLSDSLLKCLWRHDELHTVQNVQACSFQPLQ